MAMFKSLCKLIDMPLKTYICKQCRCLVFLVLYSLSSLFFPGFISYIVDDGILKNDVKKIIFYCLMMLFTGIFMIVFQYLEQVSFYRLAQEITIALKEKLYQILMHKNIDFWSEHTSGDMFTVLEHDIERLENLLTTTVSDIIVNFLIGAGIAVYLIWTDLWMGVEVLILSILFSRVQRRIGDKVERMMETLREKICELSGFTDESINNMLNIQVSGFSDYMQKKYSEKNRNVIQGFMQQMKWISIMRSVGSTFNILAILSVLVMGAIRVRQGSLSIGLLFSLTIYVQRLYSPIISLGNAYMEIRNCRPIIYKILSVIEDENNVASGDYIPKTGVLRGAIEFKNISFSYKGLHPVFHDFQLSIMPGMVVGITGDNGSGKSTLIRLLTKLCTPQQGEILLDRINVEKYNTEFLRTQIGYMQQNEFFLKGKLKDVIDPYGKMKQEELSKLMQFFQIPIELFQDSFDTEISENMLNLSGGEVQKLAMVRLFCENKPIYILDEPTAALDLGSEQEITALLKLLLKNKTAMIITHREPILDICDIVVRLN